MQRIMVDLSFTIPHHGHVRLLKKAADFGDVVVALTSDEEIMTVKGFTPELNYSQRKEILEHFESVSEVVESPWLINDDYLDMHRIDFLVHGDDNNNLVSEKRLKIFPRTKDISSSVMRKTAVKSLVNKKNNKLMLTPGPAAVVAENLLGLGPLFGRGDDDYQNIYTSVIDWLKVLTGKKNIVCSQGSSTFAIELALHTYVTGRVLLVDTGYYSSRIESLIDPKNVQIVRCDYASLPAIKGKFDWVAFAYTETSVAFKCDMTVVRSSAQSLGAKVFCDATGSIGLEEDHKYADLMAFSSCKGLFGLAGACFIAHDGDLTRMDTRGFYTNLKTHEEKLVTGPYHTLASLYHVSKIHDKLVERVGKSKVSILNAYGKYIGSQEHQPLLCTYLEAEIFLNDDNIVTYTPRSNNKGTVVCHLGEIHKDSCEISNRIGFKDLAND